MITDTYSKMMPDITMRSVLKNEDLGKLIRERRQQQDVPTAADLEKELNIYRSGSAPPTVEGSLSSIGGLFNASSISSGINKGGFVSEEELRADPAYVNYYYNNANLNPRLPPPLLSKEDWRFAQKLQGGGGGGGGGGVGGIGDRRKVGRGEESGGGVGANGNRSLFVMQPGFGGGGKEENGSGGGGVEWGGDGLIGLPGLGMGSRQKSIAEMIQVKFGDSNVVLVW